MVKGHPVIRGRYPVCVDVDILIHGTTEAISRST